MYIIPLDENVSDSLYIRYILVRYLLSINKGKTSPQRNSVGGWLWILYSSKHYPTVPSRDTCSSFCASTANSIGSLSMTSLA